MSKFKFNIDQEVRSLYSPSAKGKIVFAYEFIDLSIDYKNNFYIIKFHHGNQYSLAENEILDANEIEFRQGMKLKFPFLDIGEIVDKKTIDNKRYYNLKFKEDNPPFYDTIFHKAFEESDLITDIKSNHIEIIEY